MNNFFYPNDIKEIVETISDIHDQFAGRTILITGGRGFLGRYFTEIFCCLNKDYLENPCKIIVADNFVTSGHLGEQIEDGYTFVKQDVTKPFAVDEKVDYILHLAGIASPYYYRAYPIETLEVAITGTKNMLEIASAKNAKLLFFSSSEIYGDPDPKYVPTSESYRGNTACLGPRACYDESKRVGETLCYIYHTKFGTRTNIVRPFNVFGPGMQEKDYRVLPNFASRIQANLPLKIYGHGDQTRTFCYITDAIVGFLKVLVRGVNGEPYNIGNPKPEISMVDLTKKIEEILHKKIAYDLVIYPDSYPADEPNRRCPDITKAFHQVGYKPQVDLSDGLNRFFSWTKDVYTGEQ